MEFVLLPPGTFMMGSPPGEKLRENVETLHRVTLTRAFWMSVTPVTQAQWQAVVGNNPSRFQGENLPVQNVSWNTARKFCVKLGKREGRSYRLPTEAEWEYACRAGTSSPFFFGATLLPEQASSLASAAYPGGLRTYVAEPPAVRTYPPNGWGLYDVHGGVWQWCQDWFKKYSRGDSVDPQGPDQGEQRVIRGGCWRANSENCRSARRARILPTAHCEFYGLRVVLCAD
jgi:formylglycine-generating enzyme required for sulfatase activity